MQPDDRTEAIYQINLKVQVLKKKSLGREDVSGI